MAELDALTEHVCHVVEVVRREDSFLQDVTYSCGATIPFPGGWRIPVEEVNGGEVEPG